MNGSQAEEADEKLVPADGQAMACEYMLKLSSMSNRKSDSNCIVVAIEDAVEVDVVYKGE